MPIRPFFLGIVLLSFARISPAQTIEADLNGFRLGQFREVPQNVLGSPFKVIRHDDGFITEVFLLKPDSSLYMVFDYAPEDTMVIWSIQLTGSEEGYSCGMKGLKLGMDVDRLEKILGQPNHIKDMGAFGEKWEYDKTNYSVEIDKGFRLSSVKIIKQPGNLTSEEFLMAIPPFSEWSKDLLSGNRKKISALLSPNLEIYDGGQTLRFRYDWWMEIETDRSGIFASARKLNDMLRETDPSDPSLYEENMRFSQGNETRHVCKFYHDGKISEVVFRYELGAFRIWEIHLGE